MQSRVFGMALAACGLLLVCVGTGNAIVEDCTAAGNGVNCTRGPCFEPGTCVSDVCVTTPKADGTNCTVVNGEDPIGMCLGGTCVPPPNRTTMASTTATATTSKQASTTDPTITSTGAVERDTLPFPVDVQGETPATEGTTFVDAYLGFTATSQRGFLLDEVATNIALQILRVLLSQWSPALIEEVRYLFPDPLPDDASTTTTATEATAAPATVTSLANRPLEFEASDLLAVRVVVNSDVDTTVLSIVANLTALVTRGVLEEELMLQLPQVSQVLADVYVWSAPRTVAFFDGVTTEDPGTGDSTSNAEEGALIAVWVMVGLVVFVGLTVLLILRKRQGQSASADLLPTASDALSEKETAETELNTIPGSRKHDNAPLLQKDVAPSAGPPSSVWLYSARAAELGKRQVFATITSSAAGYNKGVYIPPPMKDCGVDNFTAARRPENKPKNRYIDILAYDRTRVHLKPNSLVPGSDYINANYVPGYESEFEYICTQGPLPQTVCDFWRLVWEQRSTLIVMLTRLVESGRVKCEKYWPDTGDEEDFGVIHVSCLHEQWVEDIIVIRTMRLFNIDTQSARVISHIHFRAWGDHDIPHVESFLRLRKETLRFRKNIVGPVIVHCSAGVGRAGTFVLVDTELNRFENERRVQPTTTLVRLRRSRAYLVQTATQFVFGVQAIVRGAELLEEQGPVGCNVQIRTFVLSFRVSEAFSDFDLCANGRRVLALGFARLTSKPFFELPVHLVLCNDVFVLTTRVKGGASVLVTAPMPRNDLYCDSVSGHWEDDLLRVSLPNKREVLLVFSSGVEKAYWLELLTSRTDAVSTSEMSGTRLTSPGPRQTHELAALLSVPNPFTTYGAGELSGTWKRVPKEILLPLEVDFQQRRKLALHGDVESGSIANASRFAADAYASGPSGQHGRPQQPPQEPMHQSQASWRHAAEQGGGMTTAIASLMHEVQMAERANDTASDMLEIEYLMKAMEVEQGQEDVRALIAQAREAEVSAMLARQRREIEEKLLQERGPIDPHAEAEAEPEAEAEAEAEPEASASDGGYMQVGPDADHFAAQVAGAVHSVAYNDEGEASHDYGDSSPETRSLYAESVYTMYTETGDTTYETANEEEEEEKEKKKKEEEEVRGRREAVDAKGSVQPPAYDHGTRSTRWQQQRLQTQEPLGAEDTEDEASVEDMRGGQQKRRQAKAEVDTRRAPSSRPRPASTMLDEHGRLVHVRHGLMEGGTAGTMDDGDEGGGGGSSGGGNADGADYSNAGGRNRDDASTQPARVDGGDGGDARMPLPGATTGARSRSTKGGTGSSGAVEETAGEEHDAAEEDEPRSGVRERPRRGHPRRHGKRKIRVQTTIAGFALAKGAAKRLAKNQYERKRALKRRVSGDLSQQLHGSSHRDDDNDEELMATNTHTDTTADPYNYLGN